MALIRREIGEILVDNGLITPEELDQAKAEHDKTGEPIGRVLAKLGLATESNLKNALELQYGVNYVDLSKRELDPVVQQLLPADLVRKNFAVPIAQLGDRITVAMVDPSDNEGLAEIKGQLKGTVKPVVCLEEDFLSFVDQAYGAEAKKSAEESETDDQLSSNPSNPSQPEEKDGSLDSKGAEDAAEDAAEAIPPSALSSETGTTLTNESFSGAGSASAVSGGASLTGASLTGSSLNQSSGFSAEIGAFPSTSPRDTGSFLASGPPATIAGGGSLSSGSSLSRGSSASNAPSLGANPPPSTDFASETGAAPPASLPTPTSTTSTSASSSDTGSFPILDSAAAKRTSSDTGPYPTIGSGNDEFDSAVSEQDKKKNQTSEIQIPPELSKLVEKSEAAEHETFEAIDEVQLAKKAQEEAIVLLANQILGNAIKRHCSNIHIINGVKECLVHYRYNGTLTVDRRLPKTVASVLVARYKMMARLNLAENRLPQDGHIKVRLSAKEIVCLVSIVPGSRGENIVIWIL